MADVFDALYEERCYKPPMRPMQKVLDILEEGKGTQFDAAIVEVFIDMKPILEKLLEG